MGQSESKFTSLDQNVTSGWFVIWVGHFAKWLITKLNINCLKFPSISYIERENYLLQKMPTVSGNAIVEYLSVWWEPPLSPLS